MSTDTPEIRREVEGSKGRYVISTPEGEAELTYSVLSAALVIADHTAVPKALEGKGYARALLDRMLDDARTEGFRIVPLCPYVNSQRARHPEWADLFSV
ncbi:GNAT family N-acetyltransferase [Histidinibacterium aquaticum]|uniref:N-acetyltransferase n=1 Tax=Histidinibacterium aquaticum TaxID=2613962 RepID=A0A5J5GRF4_9RHOB|nr:GNAT family N-acetyltransferase [Histidinibacterium aquaticum]KAA9010303.1 N-acetyltransferase [Histidinibacterium aquaticum]